MGKRVTHVGELNLSFADGRIPSEDSLEYGLSDRRPKRLDRMVNVSGLRFNASAMASWRVPTDWLDSMDTTCFLPARSNTRSSS